MSGLNQYARILRDVEAEGREFGFVERYWNDPWFASEVDRETQERRDKANAIIDAGVRAGHPWIGDGK